MQLEGLYEEVYEEVEKKLGPNFREAVATGDMEEVEAIAQVLQVGLFSSFLSADLLHIVLGSRDSLGFRTWLVCFAHDSSSSRYVLSKRTYSVAGASASL